MPHGKHIITYLHIEGTLNGMYSYINVGKISKQIKPKQNETSACRTCPRGFDLIDVRTSVLWVYTFHSNTFVKLGADLIRSVPIFRNRGLIPGTMLTENMYVLCTYTFLMVWCDGVNEDDQNHPNKCSSKLECLEVLGNVQYHL